MYNRHLIVAFIILGVSVLLLLFAGGVMLYEKLSVTDTYQVFITGWVMTLFLILAGITLCLFFLYQIIVITFINPSKLKKKIVFRWRIVGVAVLFVTLFLINRTSSFVFSIVQDMKDYKNGDLGVENLRIVDIYKGNQTVSRIIETEKGDFYMPWYVHQIEEGNIYRFTYLKRSKHILNIEDIH